MDRRLFVAGLILLFVGVALTILAPIIAYIGASTSSSSLQTRVVGGGCIVIAFIPICFGYGMSWVSILLLALVCLAIAVVMYIIWRSLVRGVGFEPTQAYASGSLT